MGSHTFWLGLTDRPYRAWDQLAFYLRATPGGTVDDALLALRPDVILLDPYTDQFVVDETSSMSSYYRALAIPKHQLEAFLARRGRLVDSVETPTFGDVRIYVVDWS